MSCFWLLPRLPAAQQLEQQHLKTLVRAVLLVTLEVQQWVKASLQVLYPLTTRLTADSLLELITEAVQCR